MTLAQNTLSEARQVQERLEDSGSAVPRGRLFNIQRCSLQDGPGIRTTVFFKGCPLRCWWCSNPESQSSLPEVGKRSALCNGCGICLEACESNSVTVADKSITIDRARCTKCGKCVEVCPLGALTSWYMELSVAEVVDEVMKDQAFYRDSGGGLTASGGEALMQPAFLKRLFRECRARGIHTTLDTSGYAESGVVMEVMEHTDLVLYDIKHMDSARHQKATGVPNELILQNAELIAKRTRVPLIFRVSLVPGVNDSQENILNTIEFARSLNVGQIDLLPYHRLGSSKYASIDRPFELIQQVEPPKAEEVECIKDIIIEAGLNCSVGG